MRCAVELMDASVSKNASNTPALLKRSKRFHTLFQWPKRSGRARQRTFSTVKKCSASRKRRSSSAFLPRRGRQARNTASVCAQSSSSIFVDIGPGPVIRSESYESCPIPHGNLEGYVRSRARRLMRHGGRPHISRIERRRGPVSRYGESARTVLVFEALFALRALAGGDRRTVSKEPR